MQSGIQTRPAALVRDPPYVFQPLTFLSPPSNTENKIHPFIKKLKNREERQRRPAPPPGQLFLRPGPSSWCRCRPLWASSAHSYAVSNRSIGCDRVGQPCNGWRLSDRRRRRLNEKLLRATSQPRLASGASSPRRRWPRHPSVFDRYKTLMTRSQGAACWDVHRRYIAAGWVAGCMQPSPFERGNA